MPQIPFNLIATEAQFAPVVSTHQYIGRFAPSPSGPLHFGSLIAALGSYLQAKANKGLWLVRIEDIDPPREVKGASDNILKTLENFGLVWDGDVLFQSNRAEQYRQALTWLEQQDLTYHCQCTRKQINQNAQYPGVYSQTCRSLNLAIKGSHGEGRAVRLKNDNPTRDFNDLLQGCIQSYLPNNVSDDFIIHRKDGLFAYQLAVVVDDIAQGISQIVRGSDLLTTSLNQMTLYQTLGYQAPSYLHLPVAVTEPGKKLSKQNHAAPIYTDSSMKMDINNLLIKALAFLNLQVPQELHQQDRQHILDWAIANWQLNNLPKQVEISIKTHN